MSTHPVFLEPLEPEDRGAYLRPEEENPPEWTCQFYVSIDHVECGEPAVTDVTTKNGLVALCAEHRAYHNRSHAQQRVRGKDS